MPTKIKGTSGIDRVEAGAIITDPTFSGNATVTGTLTVDSNASINGSNISTQPTFRNRIINGNMTIDQRGGTATINATGVTYNVDRWLGRGVASAGVFTLAQDTTSPANFTNSLKATVTTADSSIASGSSYRVQQMVEGYNIANLNWGTSDAQSVSLSFWVRSSVTGTFGGSVANGDYNRFNVFSYTISSANTWEYKTVTIAGDTSGTWVTNNALGLRLNFSLGAGSTLLTSAGSWGSSAKEGVTGQTNVIATNSATFYVTGVQLEAGTTATDFENLQYGTQLALCQRYFERYNGGVDGGIPHGVARTDLGNRPETNLFYLEKRANPTITGDSTVNFNTMANTNAVTTTGPHSFVGTGPRGANLFYYTASGVVAGALSGIGLIVLNGASDYINIDAEL